MISIIAAIGKNREIGQNNDVPWNGKLPADFKYFKTTTFGKSIIMGRKTFDSIHRKALPGRDNIVITQQVQSPVEDVQFAKSLEEALGLARGDEVFVIGGARVYSDALPLAFRLYLTRVGVDFPEADTFFPEVNFDEWSLVSDIPGIMDEKNTLPYNFQIFERKAK